MYLVRHLAFFTVLCVSCGSLNAAAIAKPNFVLIVADDLGYGDIGCYGSKGIKTPHLDRLAREGVRFTDFHSNGPMCSPTRAAMLTGLYQQRFGKKFDGALSGKTQRDTGLPLKAVTIAEALKEAGYTTGCFGKWHLGYQAPFLPTRQGFDEFRGLTSGDGDHHSHIDRSGNEDWWNNETKIRENGYTADLLVRHGIRFMERNKNRPFFVYLPHLAIHFPWQGPNDPPHRVAGTDYWSDKWGIIPNRGNVRPHVKAMVESIDHGVGEIVATLKRLELEKTTFVFFTSDNGGYINYGASHQNISSNGPLRGQKGDVFEGGHRVPAIAWWPGRIEPDVSAQTTMTFDLFPTFLKLAGARGRELDGADLSPALFAHKSLAKRTLFWRKGSLRAARKGQWKWVHRDEGKAMLFDLASDIGETRDLAAVNPAIARRLSAAYQTWEKQVNESAKQ